MPSSLNSAQILDPESDLSSIIQNNTQTTDPKYSNSLGDDMKEPLRQFPPLCKEEIIVLARKVAEHALPDGPIKKFFDTHEKNLQDILSRISQIITGEQERQHLVKLQRPLSKEDIQFFSCSK